MPNRVHQYTKVVLDAVRAAASEGSAVKLRKIADAVESTFEQRTLGMRLNPFRRHLALLATTLVADIREQANKVEARETQLLTTLGQARPYVALDLARAPEQLSFNPSEREREALKLQKARTQAVLDEIDCSFQKTTTDTLAVHPQPVTEATMNPSTDILYALLASDDSDKKFAAEHIKALRAQVQTLTGQLNVLQGNLNHIILNHPNREAIINEGAPVVPVSKDAT